MYLLLKGLFEYLRKKTYTWYMKEQMSCWTRYFLPFIDTWLKVILNTTLSVRVERNGNIFTSFKDSVSVMGTAILFLFLRLLVRLLVTCNSDVSELHLKSSKLPYDGMNPCRHDRSSSIKSLRVVKRSNRYYLWRLA